MMRDLLLRLAPKKILYKFYRKRSQRIMKKISPLLDLEPRQKIIDFGAGTCTIAEMLLENGFAVFPIDITDKSLVRKIKPLIFDGKRIPYPDKSFDTALIITVLHHTKNPEELLREAKRVARRIILIEDVYRHTLQKYRDFVMDSFINWEFFGHPHNNKKDQKWKEIFRHLNLELKDSSSWKSHLGFCHTYYWLENKN